MNVQARVSNSIKPWSRFGYDERIRQLDCAGHVDTALARVAGPKLAVGSVVALRR